MTSLAAEMAMAMRSHEEIFRYWKGLKAAGRLPARAMVNPGAFPKLLPTISLIDVVKNDSGDKPLVYRQRLAGTELFSAYGFEITGKYLDDIYTPESAIYWSEELSHIVKTKKANVGIHSMAWSGAKGLYLFWLRLPLASDGYNVDMILGHDVLLGRADIAFQTGIRAA